MQLAAATADKVTFAADDIAGREVADIGTDFDDLADELVADRHRDGDSFLRPGVPVVDMEVGAADASAEHLDENVVDPDFRDGDFFEPEAGGGFGFDEGAHGVGSRV